MKIPSNLPSPVSNIIHKYICLKLGDKCVPCTYFLNKKPARFNILWNYKYDGKGSPEQIIKITQKIALQNNFNLQNHTISQIQRFMRQKGIGVDCSGLAYQILKAFNVHYNKPPLSHVIVHTKSPNPLSILRPIKYKLKVVDFISTKNSTKINSINQIKPGDMIYLHMETGDHILIILKKNQKNITYIHSSHKSTQQNGVHFGKIKITDPNKNLKNQTWNELDKQKQPLNKKYFQPKLGDGIYRLKHWD